MKIMSDNENAFTGLEAAIVLIAFVVVAAVFSYVVLGAGFYTTQKSEEVVYTSVMQASSSIEVLGDVYGIRNATTDSSNISEVRFTAGLTAGGSPVDFNTVIMVWSTPEKISSLESDLGANVNDVIKPWCGAGNWTISQIDNPTNDQDDALLENQEQFTVFVHLPADNQLEANEKFSLEIRPAVGTSYALKRAAPPKIDAVNALY